MVQPHIDFRGDDKELYAEPMVHPRFSREHYCRIILVHGFNNSRQDALESFEKFKLAFSALNRFYAEKIFYLIWPGDLRGLNPATFFSKNVDNALAAGRSLGRYLDAEVRSGPRNCSYILVAHSLGCRLVAEMMAELHRLNPEACKDFGLLLMAGAVPVSDVGNPQPYRDGLAAARFIANMHSPDDKVLGRWFGLGEFGGGRPRSEAIGLNGAPLDFGWKLERMTGFDHSDYWPAMKTARLLAEALGVAEEISLPELRSHEFRQPEFEPLEFIPG